MPLTAIVTGAGSGIGRATCLALAQRDVQVVLAGRNFERLEETASQCAERGGLAIEAIATDVTNEEQVSRLFARTIDRFGRVDLLFNNAGCNLPPTPIEEITIQDWDQVIAVNLTGCFLCAREACRQMKRQQPTGGRIINNGSISAHVPRPLSVPYTASKHAITGLSKSLNLEGRDWSIVCTQIDIGNARTSMTERMSSGVLQADGRQQQEPTFDVAHVGEMIAHLASLPLDTNIPQLTIMATKMPYFGRG